MKLSQLSYFQTACKLNSISRAAERLHISQPAITAAIRELENEFGYPLLSRQGKRFDLTREGMAFLEETDRLLAHADQFETAMKNLLSGRRTIRVGVPPMIGSILLPEIYTAFREQGRDFSLEIVESGRQALLSRMANHELDMAFLPHDSPLAPNFQSLQIAELETVCCTAPGNPLSEKETISVSDLQNESLILFKNSFFQTERILGRFQAERLHPRILLQTDQLSTIRKLVSCDIGVGFLFGAVARSLRDIACVPLNPPMKSQVSLVWRGTDYLMKEQNEFIEFMRGLKE